MKILVYGINYAPELVGIGKYTGEMGSWLANRGYDVRVITAPPYYPDWKIWPKFSKWFYSYSVDKNITIWRCPLYVPSRPKAILRIFHLVSFAFTSMPIMAIQIFWRPNLIFLVAPTLFCAPEALLVAKITGAKSILHIQDFEVNALFGLNLFHTKKNNSILKRLAFTFESLILRSFDFISTISTAMMLMAEDKGVPPNRLVFLPNWSEISRFHNIEPYQNFLQQLGVKLDKKIVLYSGNLGEKQGLENVILAAQKLKNKKDILFLFVGEGAVKIKLIKMADDLDLSNVIFLPLQPYEKFPQLLASADVHLIMQKRGVADAVFPSKLTNVLAAGGNAVITTDIDTTLGKITLDYPGIAVIVEPESVDALVWGIEKVLTMPKPNYVARDYACRFLDKEKILLQFFQQFDCD